MLAIPVGAAFSGIPLTVLISIVRHVAPDVLGKYADMRGGRGCSGTLASLGPGATAGGAILPLWAAPSPLGSFLERYLASRTGSFSRSLQNVPPPFAGKTGEDLAAAESAGSVTGAVGVDWLMGRGRPAAERGNDGLYRTWDYRSTDSVIQNLGLQID